MAKSIRSRVNSESGEMVAYNEAAIRNNSMVIEYCRTSAAALSGATAGILGLSSWIGFAFFFASALGLWGMLLMKAGSQWPQYFVSRQKLLTSGLFSGLFTYILFWTFLYGMVHVY